MTTLTEIQTQLTEAMAEAGKAQKAFEDAMAKLQPLKDAAEEKQKVVDQLLATHQKMRGLDGAMAVAGARRKGGTLNMSPEGRMRIQVAGKLRHWKNQHPHATEAQIEKQRKKIEAVLSAQ